MPRRRAGLAAGVACGNESGAGVVSLTVMKGESRARLFRTLLVIVPLAFGVSGCGDGADPITIPTAVEVTESFSGTVGQGGVSYHVVSARVGAVTLTMNAIGPDSTATVGMSIGVLNSIACTAVMENPTARVGSQLIGTVTGDTTVCVKLYDAGTVALDDTLSYEIVIKYIK
jgi:hypothetical protein